VLLPSNSNPTSLCDFQRGSIVFSFTMPETFFRVRQIIHDIKHSWYFRFWGVLWIACVVVIFAILIVLGKSATQTLKQKDVRLWSQNLSSISYPSFHFRVGGGENQTFTSFSCQQQGVALTVRQCAAWQGSPPPFNTCRAVNSEAFQAVQNATAFGEYFINRIACNISTTGNSGDLLIAFEIEDPNVQFVGSNSYASIWIAPYQHAWVELIKSIFTQSNGQSITQWDRTLLYHSTYSVIGQYNVSVDFGSFFVTHVDQSDIYNGMMAMGDVGGFAFFMLIIHAILMILIGICFPNTSEFLGNKSEGEGVERKPML